MGVSIGLENQEDQRRKGEDTLIKDLCKEYPIIEK